MAGVDNPLNAPIYMVKLDTENAMTVGAQDIDYTLPEVPGFKLTVKAGSVTFPDGSKEGDISVTVVNANKVPMPPPNGMQPQFIVTIQPAGAKFDPPAPLTLPNTDGHAPGAQVEMYSYDHDLEEFVTIGLGTVSKDGTIIESNPGVGVIKAGWHCGSQPDGSGCVDGCTNKCFDCGPDCACNVLVRTRPQELQYDDDCKTLLCGGGWTAKNETPPTPNKKHDCTIPVCLEGEEEFVNEFGDHEPDERGDCRSPTCIDKKLEYLDVPSDILDKDKPCKYCNNKELKNKQNNILGSCDDGLFCTSADGEVPGPDMCLDGECSGTKVKDKPLETGATVSLGTVTNMIKDVGSYFKVDLPELKASVTVGKKSEVCCESKKSMTLLEEAGGTLKLSEFSTGDILISVPPYGGSYYLNYWGLETNLEYGVFVNAGVNASINIDRKKRMCEEDVCWAGSGSASLSLSTGVKAELTSNLVGSSCGVSGDKPCKLIELKASATASFSPKISVGCGSISAGGTFNGIVADGTVTAFEGTWSEISLAKTIDIVGPVSVPPSTYSLPKN